MSNPDIDKWYQTAIENGAIGGKLCFSPETLIKTENGHKEIKDIVVGEKVYDYQYVLQNVLNIIKTNYHGKILKIKISGNKNCMYVTPEHPLFTTEKDLCGKKQLGDNNKRLRFANLPIFKEAKFFKKGQCLLIPIDTEIVDLEKIKIKRDIEQKKYSRYNIYDGIPEELDINFDLLNTLGWFIAEGSANTKQFEFSMNINEMSDATIIKNSIHNMFSKHTTIKQGSTNSIRLVGTSIVLSRFFNQLCGKYAENKKIPDFVMKLPVEKQAILLRALWLGDGSERNPYDKRTSKSYTRCCYRTISFKLAKQVQELCFRLGFISGLREEKNLAPIIVCNNKKKSIKHDVYTVDIAGEDAVYFKQFMDSGILIKFKRSNSKQISLTKEIIKIDNTMYAKRSIQNIEEINYEGDVYNLSVDNSHTYIANDIAVHNCGAGSGGYFLFYTEEKKKLLSALNREGLTKIVPIKFDYEGTKIL